MEKHGGGQRYDLGMQSIVITGAGGSGGSYLAEHILSLSQEFHVWAPIRWRSNQNTQLQSSVNRLSRVECDLTDLSGTIRFLEKARPKYVFNLAAHANVRASFDVPLAVFENNTRATHNLLEALRILEMTPTFVMGSTSEVYGNPKTDDLPITENHRLNPVSPYAASKVAQEMLCNAYFQSFGIPTIITRMFTYLNPRRNDLFATAFALQVLECKNGKSNEVRHGNLESIRTIMDVRDACSAYWSASQKCVPGEIYNIAGTSQLKIGDFLKRLISISGTNPQLIEAPELLRPMDVTLQIPSSEKFRAATGWSEKYSLDESISFLIDELEALG